MDEHLLVFLMLHLQLPFFLVFLLRLHLLPVFQSTAQYETLMEAKIFREALQHKFFVVVPASDAIL